MPEPGDTVTTEIDGTEYNVTIEGQTIKQDFIDSDIVGRVGATNIEADGDTVHVQPSDDSVSWKSKEFDAIHESEWEIVDVNTSENGLVLSLSRQEVYSHEDLLEWLHDRYGTGVAHMSDIHPKRSVGVYTTVFPSDLPNGWTWEDGYAVKEE